MVVIFSSLEKFHFFSVGNNNSLAGEGVQGDFLAARTASESERTLSPRRLTQDPGEKSDSPLGHGGRGEEGGREEGAGRERTFI